MKKTNSTISLNSISNDSINQPSSISIPSTPTPTNIQLSHPPTQIILNKKSHQLIITKFQNIIIEYFHSFQTSNLESSLELPKSQIHKILIDGYITTSHIFKVILQLTKNVDSAESYAQKGICYYLEYIDQMNKISMLQTNYIDAFYISYNKTIGDIYTGSRNNSYTPINTLVSADVDECTSIKYLSYLATTMIWHKNTNLDLQQYMEIIFYHFKKYCTILRFPQYKSTTDYPLPQIQDVCIYLETVQKLFPTMELAMYFEFLEEFYKTLHRTHKKEVMNSQYFNDKCLYLSIYHTQHQMQSADCKPEQISAKKLARFCIE